MRCRPSFVLTATLSAAVLLTAVASSATAQPLPVPGPAGGGYGFGVPGDDSRNASRSGRRRDDPTGREAIRFRAPGRQ